MNSTLHDVPKSR